MFTGPGATDNSRGLLLSVLFHFAVKKILLLLIPPISGREKNAETFCSRTGYKTLHRFQDPLIQFLSLKLSKFRSIFSNGVFCIHKHIFPAVNVNIRKIRFLLLLFGDFHLGCFLHSCLCGLLHPSLFVPCVLWHQEHKIKCRCQQHQEPCRDANLPFDTHGSTSFEVSEKIIASIRFLSIENIAERFFFLLY